MQPISCSSEGIIISTPRSNLEEDDQARNREASEMQRIFGAENASHHTSLSPPVLRHPQGNSFQKFWNRQIVATVLHNECQDHFALERTFLGYLRTSLALSVLGVIVAQLFKLQNGGKSSPTAGFFDSGIPLACLCMLGAIVVLLLGAYRFWRQQNAILRGKVHVGGWEIIVIGFICMMVIMVLFVLTVIIAGTPGLNGLQS